MSANEQKEKSVRKPGGTTGDRRVHRTRRMIRQALADLMHAKRFEDITVQDILDHADIGRSTFYAHFPTKEDAAREILEEMMDSITRGVRAGEEGGGFAFPIAELFRRLRDQPAAQGIWRSNRGREYLFSVGQDYWTRRIEREMRSRRSGRGDPTVPYPVMAQMLTGAATALLNWWLAGKMPYPPEDMQEMFDRVMMPGIRKVCGSTGEKRG